MSDEQFRHRRGGAKKAVAEALARNAHEAAILVARVTCRLHEDPCPHLDDLFRRPVALSLEAVWRTGTVLALAQAAYDERALPSGHLDNARLGVLSDALEEAGATGEILSHLRSPGPHVRGCWAVDLILGRD